MQRNKVRHLLFIGLILLFACSLILMRHLLQFVYTVPAGQAFVPDESKHDFLKRLSFRLHMFDL